jgi:hypothetical protein
MEIVREVSLNLLNTVHDNVLRLTAVYNKSYCILLPPFQNVGHIRIPKNQPLQALAIKQLKSMFTCLVDKKINQ